MYERDDPDKARQRSKEWYANNRERAKEYRREYYQKNKEKAKEQRNAWRAANPEKAKFHQVKYKYGLTEEAWEILIETQGDVCAICKTKPEVYHVDHDHSCCSQRKTCGKCVRGLLCGNCNKALGLLREDKAAILSMLNYLD